ncbi:MAG: hypothetical protein CME06_14100 [Gemmatimonadetes bacterium]|nr:hypothetical protein [Gemmatimonadota bacterium]
MRLLSAPKKLVPLAFVALWAGCAPNPTEPEARVDLTGAPYLSPVTPRMGQGRRPNAEGTLGGFKLLWIESKGVYCGASCYDAEHAYRELLDRYRDMGAQIDVSHADPLQESEIAAYDMVWIALPANWYGSFSAEEADLIRTYVESGGSVQILSDGVTAPNENLALVADRLGVSLAVEAADYYAFTTEPLFGTRTVVTAGCGTVGGGTEWAVDGYTDGIVGVLDEIGEGRTLFLGDANAFTAPSLRSPYGDNAAVSDVAVLWLTGLAEKPARMTRQ